MPALMLPNFSEGIRKRIICAPKGFPICDINLWCFTPVKVRIVSEKGIYIYTIE